MFNELSGTVDTVGELVNAKSQPNLMSLSLPSATTYARLAHA